MATTELCSVRIPSPSASESSRMHWIVPAPRCFDPSASSEQNVSISPTLSRPFLTALHFFPFFTIYSPLICKTTAKTPSKQIVLPFSPPYAPFQLNPSLFLSKTNFLFFKKTVFKFVTNRKPHCLLGHSIYPLTFFYQKIFSEKTPIRTRKYF